MLVVESNLFEPFEDKDFQEFRRVGQMQAWEQPASAAGGQRLWECGCVCLPGTSSDFHR